MAMKIIPLFALSIFIAVVPLAAASAQPGPVATACKSDIAKLCAGKTHDGAVRACLEKNYAKVSTACKDALDSTGGGRGLGPRPR
jgi:hypothetical protein